MKEIEFRQWLSKNNVPKKIQSDLVSRLKRFERAIENCDIDEQYRSDKFSYLFSLFQNKGLNDNMKKLKDVNLPIGKYQLSVFKYALNKYKQFINRLTLPYLLVGIKGLPSTDITYTILKTSIKIIQANACIFQCYMMTYANQPSLYFYKPPLKVSGGR